jgi:hypothetical protein
MKSFAAVLLLLAACSQHQSLAAQASAGMQPQWQTLFDGRTLNGWEQRGDADWVVENGYVATVPGSGDGFLVTSTDYANYRIQTEFWADATGNGGIYMRVPAMGPGVNPSIEVNIMDAHAQWPTGSISNVARNATPATSGRWAMLDVTIRGDEVSVLLDGQPVAAGTVTRPHGATGRIALQHLGTGIVRYRNVKVSPL